MGLSTWKPSKTSEPSSQQPAVTQSWSPCIDIPEPVLACLRGTRALEDVNAKSRLEWGVLTFPTPPEPHKPCADPDPNIRPKNFDPQDKRPEPIWLDYFTVGSETRLPTERKEHAESLVRSLQVWRLSDLSVLVVLFIRQVSRVNISQDDLQVLAMFANALNDCFDARQSGINQFGEQFEKRVIGVLVAAWDQRCPWAMVYRIKETEAYFLPSFQLCGLVGACIKHGMFRSTLGRRLVHLLLDQATHIECIHGIRNILLHAEDALVEYCGNVTLLGR
ncbi:hypothetical protein FA13DRAFT_1733481, partial [Coprinellus micaceus]